MMILGGGGHSLGKALIAAWPLLWWHILETKDYISSVITSQSFRSWGD